MNLNWSNRVIKYVLFVFNLLFVISGIIMIAVGVSVKSYYTDYNVLLDDSYFSLPNLLIAIGSLIFFISFFGCCGAIRESWLMIFIFAVLLSIIFIMEFSAGIAGYVLRDKTTSYLTDELKKSMKDYVPIGTTKSDKKATTAVWDEIQSEFQCCGANGPEDWKEIIHSVSSTANTTPTSKSTTTSESTVSITSTSETKSTEESTAIPSSPGPTATQPNRKGVRVGRDLKLVTGDLPTSCCKSRPGASGTISCSLNDNSTAVPYTTGCVEKFGDYLQDHAVTIGGVGLAIAFIQLFGVIFACHLSKQLKHGFYST